MIQEEKISSFLSKSIFSMLLAGERGDLLKKTTIHSFKSGEIINADLPLDRLYVLMDGSLDLIDPETEMVRESGVVGRSLEMDTLILSQSKWSLDWIARSDGELLAVPFSELRSALQNNKVYEYLKRIVTRVELHKLKNDLRLLGVEQTSIQGILSALVENPIGDKNQISQIGEHSLVVVGEGTIRVTLTRDGREFAVKGFSISDFFIYQKEASFNYYPTADAKVWILEEPLFLEHAIDASVINSLNVLEHKRYEIDSRVDFFDPDINPLDEPEDEDDHLQVKDFKKDVPLPKKFKKSRPIHFLQFDEMDCAAACMAMISHYYRRKINVPAWRSLVHVTREGASMLAVRNAAKQVGYESIGVMASPKYLHQFRTPFIALMTYHYVVVYATTDKFFLIADPAKGLVKIPFEKFASEYSSNCLLIKPTEKLLEFPESVHSSGKYFFLFRDIARDFSVISLFSVVLFILSLAPPLFIQFIFDQLMKTNDKSLLMRAGIGVILLTLFMAVAGFVRSLMLVRMTNGMGVKLASLFFRHILRLPFNYFAVRNVGDITTRVEELDKIRSFLSHQLIEILIQSVALVLYSVLFYIYNPLFFWMTIGYSVVLFITVTPLFRTLVKLNQQLFYAMGKSHSVAFEQFRSLKTIQSMGAEVQARWKWEETYDGLLKMREKLNRSHLKLLSLNSIAQQVITVSFLFFAVQLFMKGELTLGQVVAVSVLSSALISPILSLVQVMHQLTEVRVSFEKIDEIITSPVEVLSGKSHVKSDGGVIEFKNVWFQYGSDLSPWVLKNIDLKIEKGEKVALVGASGSGKSTLAFMVNLIYSPNKGEITIDGVPNTQMDLSLLRNRVATILQENAIFTGTVIDNIAFGEEFPDQERVIRAAKIAEAHEFISQLSMAYSTLLGAGGKELSGGQKQRISIARAIYRSSDILILDEATSALDSITEKRVLQNLRQELKDTTCITVAHRLNTIIDSDRIIVVNQGKILEQGKHEELMRKQGAYFELFRKQVS